ncbi:MAG: metal ABC transporter substrate-binding protein [Candidatus Spyradosoma sp.]
MKMPLLAPLLWFAAALAALAGTPAAAAAPRAPKRRVVATFTVPADWVRRVAGESAEVASLVPPDADNHAYAPSPGDLKKIREADVVFAISPHFEIWFDALTREERRKNPDKFVFLGEPFVAETHAEHAHGDAPCAHGAEDPHFWTDPALVAEHCVPLIEKALGADGGRYRRALEDFVRETREKLAEIPRERRRVVTYHNNLSHFAVRFGFEIAGTILDSATTEAADPSAKRLARLAEKIRRERIPVFADATASPRLPRVLARNAGVSEPRTLRVDALGAPGSPAGDYLGMMRENVAALLAACAE